MNILILLAIGQCNETLRDVQQVVSGHMHACALLADSSVWCWGDNGACQLRAAVGSSAIAMPTPYRGVKRLVAFGNITCAYLTAGGGVCWGSLHQNIGSCSDREWVVAGTHNFAAVPGGIIAYSDSGTVRVTGRSTGTILGPLLPLCDVV